MPTNTQKVIGSHEVRSIVADGYSDWRELVAASVAAYERLCGRSFSYILPIPNSHAPAELEARHAQRVWDEFWVPIFEAKGLKIPGPKNAVSLDELHQFIQQVKRELYDCHMYMSSLSHVYDSVSNGMVSKPNTDPTVVMQLEEESVQQRITEAIYDWIEVLETESDGELPIRALRDSAAANFGPTPYE